MGKRVDDWQKEAKAADGDDRAAFPRPRGMPLGGIRIASKKNSFESKIEFGRKFRVLLLFVYFRSASGLEPQYHNTRRGFPDWATTTITSFPKPPIYPKCADDSDCTGEQVPF